MNFLILNKIFDKMVNDTRYIDISLNYISLKNGNSIDKNLQKWHNITIRDWWYSMYQNKIKLTPQDILEKNFKIDTRGYRLKEVDQFLDDIIGDYEQFLEIINGLEKEKADLLAEIMNLKQELRNSQLNVEVASRSRTGGEVTNVDIIRRLSQLEKLVYSSKENDLDDNN